MEAGDRISCLDRRDEIIFSGEPRTWEEAARAHGPPITSQRLCMSLVNHEDTRQTLGDRDEIDAAITSTVMKRKQWRPLKSFPMLVRSFFGYIPLHTSTMVADCLAKRMKAA